MKKLISILPSGLLIWMFYKLLSGGYFLIKFTS